MTSVVGFLAVVLLTVATAANGQTLECGYVTLHLGESEKQAVAELNGAGYKNFAPVDESQLKTLQTFLGPGDLPSRPVAPPAEVCEVEFVKHEISYVARHWTKGMKSELDAIHNVVEALHAIVPAPGRATCDVFSFQRTSPEDESKSVQVSCSSHAVTIRLGKTNGKPTYDIAENIGSM